MNRVTLRLLFVALLLLPAITLSAQERKRPNTPNRNKTEWLQKMKEFKHGFLSRELELTDQQSEEFFRVYDNLQNERFEAEQQVRRLERETKRKGENVTDKELDDCIAAQYDLNQRLADIDKKYEPELRKVLTRRQLFKLPHVEREFQRKLMESRRDCPPAPPSRQ